MLKYLLAFFGLLSIYIISAQTNQQLVASGKSKYVIIISDKSNKIQVQSAKIIQQYINKISGCTLSIASKDQAKMNAIIIGNSGVSFNDTSGLGGDGILIKTTGSSIILTGGNRKGILYSVYTFLQDYLGCRRYSVADIQVPHTVSITIPAIYKKEIPTFSYRVVHSANTLNNDFCDWFKLNYFMEGWGLWVHSFDKLLPPEQYFSIHPEYFALFKGKRVPDQPDLSNPDVLGIVINNLKKLVANNPAALYWSVSQNDNQHYCQCPVCTKLNEEQGSPQGSLLTFVNSVANKFPDKIISTLAYQYSEPAPRTLKPAQNVMIMLTTSSADRRIPIASQINNNFTGNLKKWGLITNQLFLWNYLAQFGNALSPFPDIQPLQPDIQLFASSNVHYVFEQGIGAIPGEFSELKAYLASRLMWNKNINVQKEYTSFLQGFYGIYAAPYISRYINLLNKNAALSGLKLYSGALAKDAATSYLSVDKIKQYKMLFQKALSVTDTSANSYRRVTKEYLSVLYAELEIKKLNIAAEKQSGSFNKQVYLALLNNYYKKMKYLNIVYLNEARKTVDTYYNEYTRLLN